jgi:hypothetical protein
MKEGNKDRDTLAAAAAAGGYIREAPHKKNHLITVCVS